MRWLRSLTAVGLLVGLAVLVPAAPACACSCPAVTAEEAVENAGVVFAGTVVAVDVPWRWLAVSGADPVTVTFEVGSKQFVAVSTGRSNVTGGLTRLTPDAVPAESANKLFVLALPD